MKKTLVCWMVFLFLAAFPAASPAAHGISAWPDNKPAAVSLSFDDGCQSQYSLGVPALNDRGLKGTFYLIIDGVTDGFSSPWSSWKNAAGQGHEIGSHTISHPHLTWLSTSNAQQEILGSKTTIETQVPSRKCFSFAYPFGDTNSTVASIAAGAYAASRGINCGLNEPPYDFANLKACSPDTGDDIYLRADAAKSQGKWLVTYIHSLNGGGDDCWGSWTIDMYTTYLDYLESIGVWAGSVEEAVKYIKERSAATLSVISSSSDQIVLRLTDTLDDSIYNRPLTLWSEVPTDWPVVTIQQGTGAVIEVVPVSKGSAKVVYYNAVPDGGYITLKDPAAANPVIAGLSPTYVVAGSPAFTLTVTGSNFISGAVVRWNGSNRTTTYVSATQVKAAITAADVASTGNYPVTVVNPDGGVSTGVNFEVRVVPPVLGSIDPFVATAGSSAFTLTASGSGFKSGARIRWNGSNRTTTYVSSTQLRGSVTASDVATAGNYNVTVANSDGGISNAVPFEVMGPLPVISSISPSSRTAGSSAFTLTVTGSRFVRGAVVQWNGSGRTTTYVSSTQLRASIPASDIATAGTYNVTVVNPDGGVSGIRSFVVNAPVYYPAITSISPSSATAGGAAFTLTVTGSNFVSGSAVRWNGSVRTTTFVSSTQLQAAVTAADIATAGTFGVTVLNPDANASNTVSFTVNAPVVPPAITSISPASATAGGSAFTLTVNGSNFVSGAAVLWNGSSRTTTYVSSTQLRASIRASDIATAGSYAVTVRNPNAAVSGAASFTVGEPVPAIAALSPSVAVVNGPAFTLTVSGSNFVSGATVRWNGSGRATTFISSTQLQAAITAADIAAAGTFAVTVVNPLGAVSSASSFSVSEAAAYSDDFNRANQSPLSGSWTVKDNGFGTLEIYGYQLRSMDKNPYNVWGRRNAEAYGSDQYSQLRSTSTPSSEIGGPAVRVKMNGTQINGYFFTVYNRTSAGIWVKYGNVPDLGEQVGADFTGTFSSGDTYMLEIVGNVLTVYKNGSSIGSRTDYSKRISSGGSPGMSIVYPGTWDDWRGGDVVKAAVPAAASLAPSSAYAGSADLALSVTGSGFTSGSVVRWNGAARTTTYVSSSQLQAVVTASDLAAAGTAAVTVYTPPPGGGTSGSLPFEIRTAPGVLFNPSAVTGGSAATGTVTLADAAPAGGAAVSLASSDNSVVSVPSSVTVPAGSVSATFQAATSQVAAAVGVGVTASYGGYNWTSTLTVKPVDLTPISLTLNPTTVAGGVGSTGTILLNAAAPTGGAVVYLSSGKTAVAQVPSSVTVQAGSASATFGISTSAVAASDNAVITATCSGNSKTATLSVIPAGASASGHTLTAWPKNRKGAVSITFDDGDASQYTLGVPALDARGLKASFFILTAYGEPLDETRWAAWRSAAASGHEIGSHSITHPYLSQLTYDEMRREVVESRNAIDNNITTRKTTTFVYPYGDYNADVKAVVQAHYIAARGVTCGLNGDPYDFYDVKGCTFDDAGLDMNALTIEAENTGKWLVVYGHSLLGALENGWGTYEIDDFTMYLDNLVTRNVWVGTFENSVKFLREKASAKVSLYSSSANEIVLSLTDTMDDTVYNQPLTLRSVIPYGWTSATVRQGSGSAIAVTPVVESGTKVIYYDAVPDGGLITLGSQ